MIERITIHTFQEKETFQLFYEGDSYVDLTLVKIIESKFLRPGAEEKSFSLIFRGAADFTLEQGIHCLTHPTQGKFDISLVPTIPPLNGENFHYYEAVFQ